MATQRPRTAGLGIRRQSMRTYNEPFTPIFQKREENEAHIIRLQLPEFNEQHVKVMVEKDAGTVVVTGDRNVGNNRLLILDTTFPIPQNSRADKVEHKFQDGVLTITIPKQITEPVTTPPLQAAESDAHSPEAKADIKETDTAAPENAPPSETKAEIKEPAAVPPENVASTEKKAEIKEPRAATLSKDDSTTEKGREEKSPENVALPETKTDIKEPVAAAPTKDDSNSVKPTEGGNGKSAELQKQASTKAAKEEAPTPTPAVAPQPAATEKGLVRGDSGKAETISNQKISSPEKGKESKTENVGKNEETAGTPSPRATRLGKLPIGFKGRKLQLPAIVSLSAVAIAVVAYVAYTYHGFSFAME